MKNPVSSVQSALQFRIGVLLLFTTVPGIAGVVIFGYYALQDWEQLQLDYSYFVAVIQQADSMEALFVAEAQQNIHRINLMTDGIWVLLSAILAAIGLHGACVSRY